MAAPVGSIDNEVLNGSSAVRLGSLLGTSLGVQLHMASVRKVHL